MKGPSKRPNRIKLGWLERFITLAGLLVVLGVWMESGRELLRAIVSRTWPSQEAIGGALVVVGVFAEVAIGLFIAYGSKRAELKANKEISHAKRRAAKAKQLAAEANLARAKIEKEMAWRVITDEQRKSLVQQLSKFAGQRISISMWPEVSEVALFRHSVAAAVNEAGWKWKLERLSGPPTLTNGFLIRATSNPESQEAANALLHALAPMARGGAAVWGTIEDSEGPRLQLIIQERGGPDAEHILFQ